MSKQRVHVIGAGLAGSEAAYFLARHGVEVVLHEMRPEKMTEAHQTGHAAELVCSNTFKSILPQSGPGMLKTEMRQMGSMILECAEANAVPGGQALAVDREKFSAAVEEKLNHHKNITRVSGEVTQPFEKEGEITLIATGPLTSPKLSQWIADTSPDPDDLYFYDAIAPIIDATSINMDSAFIANRYEKGEEQAYLNCPMNQKEYEAFISALADGEKVQPKSFEKEKFFQGCQPIEAIAAGGADSLRFGPMKPVGLTDPRTDKRPYAVVQLRPENRAKTAYNMVGFQTKLKYPEQKRIFSMIPALRDAEFLRLGSIHRNTYVCGPKILRQDLSLKKHPLVYLAGQITGVEGYLESTACGLLSAFFILQRILKRPHTCPPTNTTLGSLLHYLTGSDPKNYQPTNTHFGLFDPNYFEGTQGLKKDLLRKAISEQAARNFERWYQSVQPPTSRSFAAQLSKKFSSPGAGAIS